MCSRLTAMALLLVTVAFTWAAVVEAGRDLAFTRASTEVSYWGRTGYRPAARTVQGTGRAIERLLAAAPEHPEYLSLQASYLAWRAWWEPAADRSEHDRRQAVVNLYRALESRPAHRQSWAKMVEYASRTREGEAMRLQAQARHAALAPTH